MNLCSECAFCPASVIWKSDFAHFSLILLPLQCFLSSPPTLTAPTPRGSTTPYVPAPRPSQVCLSPFPGKQGLSAHLCTGHPMGWRGLQCLLPSRLGRRDPPRPREEAGLEGWRWLVCRGTPPGLLCTGMNNNDEYFWERGSCSPLSHLPLLSNSRIAPGCPGWRQGSQRGHSHLVFLQVLTEGVSGLLLSPRAVLGSVAPRSSFLFKVEFIGVASVNKII